MSLKFSLPTVHSLPFWQMVRWLLGVIWKVVAKFIEAGADFMGSGNHQVKRHQSIVVMPSGCYPNQANRWPLARIRNTDEIVCIIRYQFHEEPMTMAQ